MNESQSECTFEADFALFQDFLIAWEDKTFDLTNHAVYGLVRNQAYSMCRSFQRYSEKDDLTQTGLIRLKEAKYKGECPLGGYVHAILRNEITALWKQTGRGKVEITDDFNRPVTAETVDEICRRLASDKFMRHEMAARPLLQREIVSFIVMYDGSSRFSRAKVIRALQRKNFARYDIIVAYDRLREYLCRDQSTDSQDRKLK